MSNANKNEKKPEDACSTTDVIQLDAVCSSCAEGMPKHECTNSKRSCGHHCNHSWEQDKCCWCGAEFGES